MRVAVTGCSFSDYTNVDKVYGEFLSESLNAEYVHLASGCGSNDRSFRKIIEAVENNVLTKDDFVFLQLTNPERREIFSKYYSYSKIGKKKFEFLNTGIEESGFVPVYEKVDGYDEKLGNIELVYAKFKEKSYTWQEGLNKQIHQYVENNIADPLADMFYTEWKLRSLVGYLQHNQIKICVMYSQRYINSSSYKNSPFREGIDFVLEKLFPTISNEEHWCTPEDASHMNEIAHRKLAFCIGTHLVDNNLL